jgi:nitroreductase
LVQEEVEVELIDVIKGRRSIRRYQKKKIPRDVLGEIVEAGIWAPSGSNVQAWKLIVVDNDEVIKSIKSLSPGMFDVPAAIVVVCRDLKRAHDMGGELGEDILSLMDISMASQNIMLRAYDLGVGSCAIRSFGMAALKRFLDLPDYISPELLITLGYPAEMPIPPKRRKVEEVVQWWREGNG